MFSYMLCRVFADHNAGLALGFNIWLPNFINFFKQGLILCFELNILDDCKIANFIKFSFCSKQFLLCF